MHNSQWGPSQPVLVISKHNLKHCPPPHCLVAALCTHAGQIRLDGIHAVFSAGQESHIVYPRGSVWVISPGRQDRCVYRDTVCSLDCLEGTAVPVNTAELWGPHTCSGQVQVSWDVFMWVRGGRFMCVHSCVHIWERSYCKEEGLQRLSIMII